MSFEAVYAFFRSAGLAERVLNLAESSATVEEAARAVGCELKQIAKTMAFYQEERPVLILAAGDGKVDNKKYKAAFGQKAKMIPGTEVEQAVGHAPGGVCPFVNPEGVVVYLDESLKRFAYVYPAAGSGHSAVKLTISELETLSGSAGWVDVCKDWA